MKQMLFGVLTMQCEDWCALLSSYVGDKFFWTSYVPGLMWLYYVSLKKDMFKLQSWIIDWA